MENSLSPSQGVPKARLMLALKPGYTFAKGVVVPKELPGTPSPGNSSSTSGPSAPTKEQYIEAAHKNLMVTSRTANGVVDTSASPEKAAKMAVGSGDEAASAAKSNFTDTMGRLHDERHKEFKTPHDLLAHVDGVNRSINRGIVKDSEFLRTDDSTKYDYVPVKDMEAHRQKFAKEFHARLDSGDPKDTAAWIHHALNHRGHYYADGVGKTAEAVSNWVMMRHGHELPTYRSRKEIFENVGKGDGGEKWGKYYRTLFPSGHKEGEASGSEELKKSARALFQRTFRKSAEDTGNVIRPHRDLIAPKPGIVKPTPADVYVGRYKGEHGKWTYTHNGEHFDSGDAAMAAMRARFPKPGSTVPHPSVALRTGDKDSKDHNSNADGTYKLPRKAVHERIINHFLGASSSGGEWESEENKPRHAIFMGGGAGSGKGYTKNAAYGHHRGFMQIDPDEIKKHLAAEDGLPGVENHHPNFWHEESSDLSKALQKRAHAVGRSYIFDGTGANADSVIKKMGGATQTGYQLHARKVETPRDLAWYRNNERPRTVPPEAFHNTHDGVQSSWPKIVAHVTSQGGTHDVFSGNAGSNGINDKSFPKGKTE